MNEHDTYVSEDVHSAVARRVRGLSETESTRLVRDYAYYVEASLLGDIKQYRSAIEHLEHMGFTMFADHWLAGEFVDNEQGPVDRLVPLTK